MRKKRRNLVVCIYFHPEAYPPTLNAVGELSECFDQITIVHRPHLYGTWNYPSNIKTVASGRYISSRAQEAASLLTKITFFIGIVNKLLKQCLKQKPAVILVYDSLSLYAYHIIKPLLRFKHKIWYHNHDVVERQLLRRFSIGWFAAKTETKAFQYLDIFSLPTNERLQYFPMQLFKGRYFFIPNYPAIKFYNQFYQPRSIEQTARIIFQGQVGPFHGIEEIIPLLKETILNHRLELVLKGPCLQDYMEKVIALAEENNVSGNINFIGITPYYEVPVASSTCHIGLGILAKKDLMNTTLGTASNKLYEYAAVGLPVIYYDSENFTRHLSKYSWALPSTLTTESIRKALKVIIQCYTALSAQAHSDFVRELNFEKGFAETKHYFLTGGIECQVKS